MLLKNTIDQRKLLKKSKSARLNIRTYSNDFENVYKKFNKNPFVLTNTLFNKKNRKNNQFFMSTGKFDDILPKFRKSSLKSILKAGKEALYSKETEIQVLQHSGHEQERGKAI